MKAKRFTLDNGNAGSRPFVTEPMEADVRDAFDVTKILLSTLGFPLFDVVNRQTQSSRFVFHCKGPSAEGRGAPTDDGFIVYEGSLTRAIPTASTAGRFSDWFDELRDSGILQPVSEDQCRLTRDYVVSSPSYAAALILARNANGWTEWKLPDGRTLHDVYRTEEESDPNSFG